MQKLMIALLECSISMSVIGLLYMAATPFLQNRFSAKGRYYAWLAIVIGFIVPFRFHLPAPVVSVDALLPALEKAVRPSHDQAFAPATATAAAFPWHVLAGGIWISGAVAFLASHTVRHRRLLYIVKRWSVECSDRQARLLLQEVQANMNITRKVDLRVCPGILTPMLIGFVRPVILLPSSHIPAHELLFILKHELVHLKRGDLGYKTLVFLATALHWFNPFVYRMAREIALQCELSCDEEVVKQSDTNSRQRYVEAIIGVMKKQSGRPSVFSTGFSDSRLNMQNRVLSIMDTRSKKWGISLLMVIVLATIGTGAVLNLGPTNSESWAPKPANPIAASGNVAEQEENRPPASPADPASLTENPEGEQSGTVLEPGVPERGVAAADSASPLLIPVPASEQNTSIPGDPREQGRG